MSHILTLVVGLHASPHRKQGCYFRWMQMNPVWKQNRTAASFPLPLSACDFALLVVILSAAKNLLLPHSCEPRTFSLGRGNRQPRDPPLRPDHERQRKRIPI